MLTLPTLKSILNSLMLPLYLFAGTAVAGRKGDPVPTCGWVTEEFKNALNKPVGDFLGFSLYVGGVAFLVILAMLVAGAVFFPKYRGGMIGGAILLVVVGVLVKAGLNPVPRVC